MRVRAFAKINLSLRVLGRRPDGYHDLRTVFQSVSLHDTLTIRRGAGQLRVVCDDSAVPHDRTNLVWRAADALWHTARRPGRARGVTIQLHKRIPLQAGLGGGSSDAAATLRALARLWRIEEPYVRDAAAELGADVPYFLEGGTVLGLERGDVLFPLLDRPRAWVVLVIPAFQISTPDAYQWWDVDHTLRQRQTRRNPVRIAETMNDLQGPVSKRFPAITGIVGLVKRAGADHAAMSGSGSAVFGLFAARTAAERAAAAVGREGLRAVLTRTLSRAEYWRLAGN